MQTAKLVVTAEMESAKAASAFVVRMVAPVAAVVTAKMDGMEHLTGVVAEAVTVAIGLPATMAETAVPARPVRQASQGVARANQSLLMIDGLSATA